MSRKVTIQSLDVCLRIMVEVDRHEKLWRVRYLDRALVGFRQRSMALATARWYCEHFLMLGVRSELVVKRLDGKVGERRTYGKGPR